MKKLLVVFALCLCLCLLFVACGEEADPTQGSNDQTQGSKEPHTHSYGAWVTVSLPTCDTDGQDKRTCSCGEFEVKVVVAFGHTETVLEAREPTCTVAGLTEGKGCSECGAILVPQDTIPTISHEEQIVEGKEPTCTEGGLTEGKVCTDCGETLVAQEPIPPKHTEEVVEGYPATCYNTGLTDGLKCTACGETLVEQTEIPISHIPEILPAKEPTCYEKGLTEGSRCSICFTPILPQQEIDEKHEPTVVEGYAPDCFNDGKKDGIFCSLCGKVIQEQEIIPAHHELVLIPGKIATCTETGLTNGYECSVCKNIIVKQEEIPYTLHNFVDGNCTHCSVTAFSQGLKYSLSDDGQYYILEGRGSCTDLQLIIPETYRGKPVKEIAPFAFQSDRNIISIVFPKTIETIGSAAFDYVTRLIEVYNLSSHLSFHQSTDQTGICEYVKSMHTQLDEPSVLKVVGDFIFAEINTPKIVAYTGSSPVVVLPDEYNGSDAYEIYDYAFCDRQDLVSIVVPWAVKKVGVGAFGSNPSLVEVYYMAGMQIEYNGSWMQGDLGHYAVAINSSLDVPSIIDIVGDYVFMTYEGQSYLVRYIGSDTRITLPTSYKGGDYAIYKNAFNSAKIEYVTIAGGVTAIGERAFAICQSLKELIIENGVNSIGQFAFEGSSIRRLVLSDEVTSIGDFAFNTCTYLASVTLGNGIEAIGAGAFYSCINLVSITLPKSLKTIGGSAFGDDNSFGLRRLKEIINHSSIVLTLGGKDNGYIAYNAMVIKTGENDEQSFIMEGDYAFVLVDGKYYLAAYLGNDRDLVLPSSINGSTYEIASHFLRSVSLIYTIVIPDGVTAIGEYAFRGCTHLTSISIAGSVKTIGTYAFQSCGNLTDVTLAEGVETLNKYAFYYCTALESIKLPKSLKAIGSNCFYNCSVLASVEFGDPNNWYTTSTEGAASGTDQKSRTDDASNASFLTSSSGRKLFWYKKK